MFNCRKTQIYTNKELILSLGSKVHASKAPCTSKYAKINEALNDWYVLTASLKEYLPQRVGNARLRSTTGRKGQAN